MASVIRQTRSHVTIGVRVPNADWQRICAQWDSEAFALRAFRQATEGCIPALQTGWDGLSEPRADASTAGTAAAHAPHPAAYNLGCDCGDCSDETLRE